MFKIISRNFFQVLGLFGTLIFIVSFILAPNWPTPDKIIVFLTFIFMIFSQAVLMLKRLLPFVFLLIVYESFRGIAHQLNQHVNYTLMPHFDKWLFGQLPTVTLQKWLWHGYVQWYDYYFYLFYMLFFVFPIALAVVVWKKRENKYWEFVTTYLTLFFGAFLTYFLFPAAPPWMASDRYIPHINWISIAVWQSLGLKSFPTVYTHIAPNPVAAVPSLHAGCSTLLALFIFKFFGRKWGVLSLIYPISIYIGVVYQGEHYAFDVFLGIIYAFVAYFVGPYIYRAIKKWLKSLKTYWRSPKSVFSNNTKSASKSSR